MYSSRLWLHAVSNFIKMTFQARFWVNSLCSLEMLTPCKVYCGCHFLFIHFPFLQLNFLVTENRQRDIVDPNCEGVQIESLDALLSIATQCVSSSPEERPTMHRVVQLLESEVMTPCPSDFYDSSGDNDTCWVLLKECAKASGGSLESAAVLYLDFIRSFFLQIYDNLKKATPLHLSIRPLATD